MKKYLADYAYFTDDQEMERAVEQHLVHNSQRLNDSDRKVIETIKRHSAQYCSAHLSYFTIEKAIGKSNATVRRSIRKLERLKIIERTHYVRPVMNGLGANIYAIKPFKLTVNGKSEDIETSVVYEQQTLQLWQ